MSKKIMSEEERITRLKEKDLPMFKRTYVSWSEAYDVILPATARFFLGMGFLIFIAVMAKSLFESNSVTEITLKTAFIFMGVWIIYFLNYLLFQREDD